MLDRSSRGWRRAIRGLVLSAAVSLASMGAATAGDDPAPATADWSADEHVPQERLEKFRRYIDFQSMVRGVPGAAHWIPGREAFWYSRSPGNDGYRVFDASAGTEVPVMDLARLEQAVAGVPELTAGHVGFDLQQLELNADASQARVVVNGRTATLDLATYALKVWDSQRTLERERQVPQRIKSLYPFELEWLTEVTSPSGRRLVTLDGPHLALRDTVDSQVSRLAEGTKESYWMTWGATWGVNDNLLAAIRVDATGVYQIPIVDWLQKDERVRYYEYPKVGTRVPQWQLHLIDVHGGDVRHIDTGSEFHYLRVLHFDPSGKKLYVLKALRAAKAVELLEVDVSSGIARTILSEASESFLWYDPFFLAGVLPIVHFLEDGQRLLWSSERDGRLQLYLYDLTGKQLAQVTRDSFPVANLVHVDERRGLVYYTAAADAARPYDEHLHSIPLGGGRATQLSEAPGKHEVRFSPSGNFYIDTHSTVTRPPTTELRTAEGALVAVLGTVDISELNAVGWHAPEPFVAKAADVITDLHGVIYKPYNFDPGRRYPVIEYIYGGPFTTTVQRKFVPVGGPKIAQAIAQLGFVVVISDARGTPGRGKAFHDIVYRKLGQHETADHAAALRGAAATRPYMDLERVGIFGHSYGGYFATRALLQAPDLYKVGVGSAAPDINPNVGWDGVEAFMGTPQDNPDGYARAGNAELADRLRGKLLLIIPTSDINVPPALTLQFVDALIRADRPHDLVVIPGQNHQYGFHDTRPDHEIFDGYWVRALRRYFWEHLSPD